VPSSASWVMVVSDDTLAARRSAVARKKRFHEEKRGRR